MNGLNNVLQLKLPGLIGSYNINKTIASMNIKLVPVYSQLCIAEQNNNMSL